MELEDPTYTVLYKFTKALSVALGYRDLLTRLHSERVRGLCEAIGMACDLSGKELGLLKIASSFHDLGKIGVPDQILLKPSPFDAAEWAVMQQHAKIGERIMAMTELEGSPQVALLIRHHHEHYNGSGYPDSLAGTQIPLGARIISIADSYDAMAVMRPYHRPRTHLEVMAILHREAGEKHDPDLMRTFCGLIESSPLKTSRH